MTVVAFAPTTKARKRRSTASQRTRRAYGRQALGAMGAAMVAVVMTGLSLKHQATGVMIFTQADMVEAMAMAIGIDCGMIVSELTGVLTVTDKVRREVHRWSRPMVIGCALASAAMNTMGFVQGAEGYLHIAGAVLMGCGVPAIIFHMTRQAVAMWTDCSNKAAQA